MSAENAKHTLRALTAEYVAEQHSAYVDYIQQAIDTEGVTNIALTGNYGTGKSSILKEVAHRNGGDKTLTISLSTLGGEASASESGSMSGGSDALSTQIQREIVKQLLFRERPEKVRRSSYRRVGKFSPIRAFGKMAAATIAGIFLLWLTGALERIVQPPFNDAWLNAGAYALAFLIVAGSLTLLSWVLNPRLGITQVGAGGASVTIGTADASFDKNLEEIIYFFEVTKVGIVIFEDIDRFENAKVFEPLRELNVLLNGSRQVKQPVRFIYALKDSIFDDLGKAMTKDDPTTRDAADAELARANRTKFFDWVVPIVPFITHLNAPDLMHRLFQTVDVDRPSPQLLDTIAEQLTDMRLMKNVVNEYEVFARQLMTTVLGITPDLLMAMVVYKNIHLSDYELISKGTSDLHRIYRASREIKAHVIRDLEKQISIVEQRIADHGSQGPRASQLGTELSEYLTRVARHLNPDQAVTHVTIDTTYDLKGLQAPEFWTAAASVDTIQVVTHRPRTAQQTPLTVRLDDLRKVLGDPIRPDQWATQDLAQLHQERDKLKRQVPQVQHASFSELCALSWARIPADKLTRQSLPAGGSIPTPPGTEKTSEGPKALTFSQIVDATLRSELAKNLLRSGHITQDFALYVAHYYDTRVPRDARLFVIQHVDPGIPDYHFDFSSDEAIDSVLATRPGILDTALSDNIAIVDRLARAQDERLARVAVRLAPLSDSQRDFLDAYLAAGKHHGLISAMAGTSTSLLTYLASHGQLTEPLKVTLLSEALGGIKAETEYETTPALKDILLTHYRDMPAFTKGHDSEEQVDGIVSLLRRLDMDVPDIKPLDGAIRFAVIDAGVYTLTSHNLTVALGSDNLTLDYIKAKHPEVYTTVLSKLDMYADLDIPITVAVPGMLEEILRDFPAATPLETCEKLIRRAAHSAGVLEVAGLPPCVWPSLMRQDRAPTTFANVSDYLQKYGVVDAALGQALVTSGVITEIEEFDHDARAAVAKAIINAPQSISDPALRTKLAAGLNLGYLEADEIEPEGGALLFELINADLLADEATSFEHFFDAGWEAIEGGLHASMKASTFLSPSFIHEEHLHLLWRSLYVPRVVKDKVIQDLRLYAPDPTSSTIGAALEYATTNGISLSGGTLHYLAEAGCPGPVIVKLLEAAPDLDDTQLIAILNAMPPPYPELTVPGKKSVSVPHDTAHEALGERLKRVQGMNLVQRYNRPKGRLSTQATLTHPEQT